MEIEADIGPAGAFGRDMGDAAMGTVRFDLEIGHGSVPPLLGKTLLAAFYVGEEALISRAIPGKVRSGFPSGIA
ncbi:hypothetical protein RsS62_39420 [Rhizobium dioscoreae]|nr:hypothetical protein RsS62_39420 [Rhizobium dioscoreae]